MVHLQAGYRRYWNEHDPRGLVGFGLGAFVVHSLDFIRRQTTPAKRGTQEKKTEFFDAG